MFTTLKSYFFKTIYFYLKFWVDTTFNLTIEGLENIPKDQGVLVVANHASYIDIVVIARAFYSCLYETSWVISKSNFRLWYLKGVYALFTVIVVNGTTEKVSRALKNNRYAIIFPEGGKRWCPPHKLKKRKARTGAAAIALSTGCTILPIGLSGTEKVLPPSVSRLNLKQPIRLSIGEPFKFNPGEKESINKRGLLEVTHEIMSRVYSLTDTKYML